MNPFARPSSSRTRDGAALSSPVRRATLSRAFPTDPTAHGQRPDGAKPSPSGRQFLIDLLTTPQWARAGDL